MVTDGHLQHAVSAHRAAGHELDRPPVGHLTERERPQHLGARGPERSEIGQREAIEPADQCALDHEAQGTGDDKGGRYGEDDPGHPPAAAGSVAVDPQS